MTVLSKLINITWKTGQLAKDWKTAVLILLVKKNRARSAPSSYRPISMTSCIGTRVERMINERLNWGLEHNNIITPCQVGFRRNYPTEDQLIRLTQKIPNGFQMNKGAIAVFVDLEKAYDKVWRQGIFIKMRDAGIQQHVPMDKELSHGQNNSHRNRSHINKRVPQGRDTAREHTQLHPLHDVHQ